MDKKVDQILCRNHTGYVMSKFLSKDDLYKQMREDINTLCEYIEHQRKEK